MTYPETVAFLQRLGVADVDIFNDAPADGLWVSAAGLRVLVDRASDSAGKFAVRAMLTGGPEMASMTIHITPRDAVPRLQPLTENRLWHRRLLRRLGRSKRLR